MDILDRAPTLLEDLECLRECGGQSGHIAGEAASLIRALQSELARLRGEALK